MTDGVDPAGERIGAAGCRVCGASLGRSEGEQFGPVLGKPSRAARASPPQDLQIWFDLFAAFEALDPAHQVRGRWPSRVIPHPSVGPSVRSKVGLLGLTFCGSRIKLGPI